MTGNASDLEFVFDRDEGGDRLLLGVESGTVKLAVVVPDDVPRATLKTATAGCVRELLGHAGASDGRDADASRGRDAGASGGPAAGDAEQAVPGYDPSSAGHEHPSGDE